MRKYTLSFLAIAVLSLTMVSCKKEAKKVEQKVEETAKVVKDELVETKYKVIPAESNISWKANKIVGSHEGTVGVSNGVAKLKGDQLVGGTFMFDVKTLKVTDIKESDKQYAKLVGHLLAPDFLNAEKNPTAMFEVKSNSGRQVTGDLTLNGVKKSITVPVTVVKSDNGVSLMSDTFTIDRTEFGIMYNSDKAKGVNVKKLGDKLIKNDVEIKINVKAQKA